MIRSIVDIALFTVGSTAGGDGSYEQLIATDESDAVARSMDLSSGCGLCIRGWLRRWCEENGVTPPSSLTGHYTPGTALELLLALARAAGAVVSADAVPEPGDIVWLGNDEHVEVVVEVDAGAVGAAAAPWRVAGGERDEHGLETIRCVTRSGAPLATAPAAPAVALAPRQVLRLVRFAQLAAYLEAGF